MQEEPQTFANSGVTFEREAPRNDEDPLIYEPFVPEVIGEQAEFLDKSTTSQIKRIIEEAVEKEAPVSRNVLMHCVLDAFSAKKTAKTEARFNAVLDSLGFTTTERGESVFVWKRSQEPGDYDEFRTASGSDGRRKPDDIATEELAAAVVYILRSSVSLERAELVRETVRLFGATRTTEAGELAVSMGISCAVRSGKAAVDQETGRIMYAGDAS